MSNIFQQVLTDATSVQDKLLGPTYPYFKNIKNPEQLGISSRGSLQALAKDIDGLVNYVEVLVSGDSKASTTGGPLGNRFFLQTGAKCLDKATNQQVDRYIYVNNIPSGKIPFISNAMDTNFSDAKGLIPGVMSNLNVLNPYSIMQSFLSGSTPECQKVSLEVIDINNNSSNESHYVTTVDLQNMDACSFPGGHNPYSGKKCSETFRNIKELALPNDKIIQLYFICLAILGLFLLHRMGRK